MMKVDQLEPDIQIRSNEDTDSLHSNARIGFIRKVYSLLSIQLLLTAILVAFTMAIPSYAAFQLENMWLFYLAIVGSFATLIPLACCRGLSKQVPLNYILLFTFTLFESYLVSMICLRYSPQSVLQAAIATCAASIGLTIYAMKTKSDFTTCFDWMIGFFWSFFFIATTITLINIFFIKSNYITVLIAIGFATIYSLYLIIDTQLILGGKNAELTLDNYVLGAVLLYLDIINLFIQLLKIIGKLKE